MRQQRPRKGMSAESKRAERANGDGILRRRKHRGWTQADLAKAADVSERTVGRAEASELIQVGYLGRIARALGATISEINVPTKALELSEDGAESHRTSLLSSGGNACLPAGATLARSAASPRAIDDCRFSLLPPPPALVIGREEATREIKRRLRIDGQDRTKQAAAHTILVIRGWPGVGKTTMLAALAHDPEIGAAFKNGILWISLGQQPNLFAKLSTWAATVGLRITAQARTVEDVSRAVAGVLATTNTLLIVDDVWESAHAAAFRVGGSRCATLFTTRENRVAQAITALPSDIYPLAVLKEEDALTLFHYLAPGIVDQHPDSCLRLVRLLEGLPLAIRVAGKLLAAEALNGWGADDLLEELLQGSPRLLNAEVPADMADLDSGTTPTMSLLFRKSTDRLDTDLRAKYALLGGFAPEPAILDLKLLAALWEERDPRPTVRCLVERGLIEPLGNGRFQLHALLIAHAQSLLND